MTARNPDLALVYPLHAIGSIDDGVDGVRQTLDIMRRIARQFRSDPRIRALAEEIISEVPSKSFVAEIGALFNYVRDNIRYTLDVNEVETLKDPVTLIESGFGDCDDMSLLLATLLESVGHPARFKAVGFAPGDFEHVYVQTHIGPRQGGTWISLDTTMPHPMGWQPPNIQQFMLRDV